MSEESPEARACVDRLVAEGRLRPGQRPSGPVEMPTLVWPDGGESLGDACVRLRGEERN